MILGSLKDVQLKEAVTAFLLDCHAIGVCYRAKRIHREVLISFISFTGDMVVRELGPDHVRMYIANLSDCQSKDAPPNQLRRHYSIIRKWIRWIYAQNQIAVRGYGSIKSPRLRDLFPLLGKRILTYCG